MILLFFLILDDYNRVVLQTLEGASDSDYINASFVDVSITIFYVSNESSCMTSITAAGNLLESQNPREIYVCHHFANLKKH